MIDFQDSVVVGLKTFSSILEYWLGKQSGQDFESTLPFSN